MFAKQMVTLTAVLLAGLALARPALADNPRRYSINDLGTLGGTGSTTESVNDSKVAVGNSYINRFLPDGKTQIRRAFIWDKTNGMRDLGTLGGDSAQDDASAINNAGTVVGYAATAPDAAGNSYIHAFVYDSLRGMRDLTPGLAANSKAIALNDNGEIAGGAEIGVTDPTTGIPYEHAVKWVSTGVMTDLGTLGGTFSEARAINNAGTVVGYGDLSAKNLAGSHDWHSFVWDSANGLRDMGVPPITFSGKVTRTFMVANSINNKGEAVGFVNVTLDNFSSGLFSFVWASKNGPRSLFNALGISFGGKALINNDNGLIGGGGFGSAVLYDPTIGVVDLSKAATTKGPGVTYAPRDIGALSGSGLVGGDVVVNASDGSSNAIHAFLLQNNPPPTVLAADVTAQVTIKRGGFRLNLINGSVDQRVIVTNTGSQSLPGPLSIVVASIKNATLRYYAVQDYVNWHTPLVAPYVDLGVDAGGALLPGHSVSVILHFDANFDSTFTYPIYSGITYSATVLAGPGAR